MLRSAESVRSISASICAPVQPSSGPIKAAHSASVSRPGCPPAPSSVRRSTTSLRCSAISCSTPYITSAAMTGAPLPSGPAQCRFATHDPENVSCRWCRSFRERAASSRGSRSSGAAASPSETNDRGPRCPRHPAPTSGGRLRCRPTEPGPATASSACSAGGARRGPLDSDDRDQALGPSAAWSYTCECLTSCTSPAARPRHLGQHSPQHRQHIAPGKAGAGAGRVDLSEEDARCPPRSPRKSSGSPR